MKSTLIAILIIICFGFVYLLKNRKKALTQEKEMSRTIDSLRVRDGNYFFLTLAKDKTIDKFKSSREWDDKDSATEYHTNVLNGINH